MFESGSLKNIQAANSGWSQSRVVNRAQDTGLAGTLNGYLFLDHDLRWDETLEKKVLALSPEEINAAMKKYISVDKMNIIKAGDFAKVKGGAGN